jgi:glucose-1-phosphate cytidylyltransferase
MRVVLFCGGLGMRLRDYSESIPKPMVPIGGHPLLWWVMKYYAHFGHKDFILCLGYKGDAIKEYFLNYNECMANDFVMTGGRRHVEPLQKDISDWRITFVDTGMHANIGERLLAVKPYLRGEDMFLANYTDGLSDLHLPSLTEGFAAGGQIASFLSVRPNSSFHFVRSRDGGTVTSIDDCLSADVWINGGFFALRREIFDYILPGDELVVEPFQRLIAEGRLSTLQYEGFWRCIDTSKDLQALESLSTKGRPPWDLWGRTPGSAIPDAPAARRLLEPLSVVGIPFRSPAAVEH